MLEITILKEDILNYGYANSRTCSITQALARAGRPELRHGGFGIANHQTDKMVLPRDSSILQSLSRKVQGMSMAAGHTFFIDKDIVAIPPETFTVQLPIN